MSCSAYHDRRDQREVVADACSPARYSLLTRRAEVRQPVVGRHDQHGRVAAGLAIGGHARLGGGPAADDEEVSGEPSIRRGYPRPGNAPTGDRGAATVARARRAAPGPGRVVSPWWRRRR